MKIAYVCADSGIAPDGTKGASVHLRSIVTALARAGHDITVLTRRAPARPKEFPLPWKPLEDPNGLRRDLREASADLVVERYSLGHVDGLDAAREIGAGFVLEMNAPLVEEAARYRGQDRDPEDSAREARLLRESDAVAVVSNPLRDHVVPVRGSSRGVGVVRNGYDPEASDMSTGSSLVSSCGGRIPLAFLGHPKPWHGADRLPRLVNRLVDLGYDVEVRIIGGGPGADAIRDEAASIGLADRVVVSGAVSHPEAVRRLGEAALSLAPYPAMPFFYFCPIKVIESMGAGVPVVASAIGDIPEIVGECGVLVPPGDDDSLATAIARLLDEPQRLESLACAAHSSARSSMTWDHSARALVELATASIPSLSHIGARAR